MSKVAVIGCGAAGMFAAAAAAKQGHQTEIFEKNERAGKKLYITGKGRCNLTNDCDPEEVLKNVCTNRKFLYSAVYGWTSQDTIRFFQNEGMRTKTERGNRVFPESDRSADVIDTLRRVLERLGVTIHFGSPVKDLWIEEGKIRGLIMENGTRRETDAVIVATGGLSYASTGSTGDGFRFARAAGHTVTALSPALVPMNIKESFCERLQGLSLRNVKITVLDGKKKLFEDFGEMLFTHYGVSGPLILSASSLIGRKYLEKKPVLSIDLKPALSTEQLNARILRDFEKGKNRQFKNALGELFPAKLIPVMVDYSEIAPDKAVNEITREERLNFSYKIKNFRLTITGLRDYNEAIITKGGVSVKEVNPSTMESKFVKGLFFAGEVLDLDALTGGFNLQIAWSTARAAGLGIE
ncbi:MAG TPA: NAD(P)/FAD-dependent oxidoreductase [Candidatus Limivivens intestinipullorum]|uniref:NAD(P)/FAD-dependent oxidoreductase n=1 Tax=Candidatus Limivivens intestinipullorum TaxID=2840858 RepID=A0A9D1EVH2_9FIRM|nr:NAD(P)/FAD-dependent oxidoreductase [Candidatus Limivivens intestinipullorum]